MQKHTFNPFHVYASALKALLTKAGKSKNPALYLYTHEARTPLFMLEALTRMYTHHTGGSKMNIWRKHFKKLEDELGVVDYYDGFLKEFKKNKHISPEIIAYIEKKKTKSLQKLQATLTRKGWLNGLLKRFDIANAYIDYDGAHIKLLHHAIHLQEDRIMDLVKATRNGFTELEEEVHELRRQCRWLSMYTQALCGIIQLKTPAKHYAWEKYYITNAVIKNPYNRVAKAPEGITPIYYDASVVYALSDLIAKLGVIKDKGLGLELLAKGIRKTQQIPTKAATAKALTLLGKNYATMPEVLKEAFVLCHAFFMEHKVFQHGILVKTVTSPRSRR
ncbi:MAG: hypothetical protein JST26_06620 [Bacteroidetes bacterium]|nr:hypothetical protein [Bacteroidota bacterium]